MPSQENSIEPRLTENQLGQVVAELTRLAQSREDELRQRLDREQVVQVLKELDLPVELLEEAMERLRRQQELAATRARERRRKVWYVAGGAAILLTLILAIILFTSHRNAQFDRISADTGRITRTVDDGGALDKVVRDGREVVYHVMLRDVPQDRSLSLSCRWIDPSGRVFRESHWETRLTDKSTWPTWCKCQLGAAAPEGTWRVEISLDERVLSTATFQVE